MGRPVRTAVLGTFATTALLAGALACAHPAPPPSGPAAPPGSRAAPSGAQGPAAAPVPEPAIPAEAVTGRTFAEQTCSSCHAIGRTGASPEAAAPPFRTLSRRYPIESLAEAFSEGIFTGHPMMPQFELSPGEIDALIAWLRWVQDPPDPAAQSSRAPDIRSGSLPPPVLEGRKVR
jgi:cytochrome c